MCPYLIIYRVLCRITFESGIIQEYKVPKYYHNMFNLSGLRDIELMSTHFSSYCYLWEFSTISSLSEMVVRLLPSHKSEQIQQNYRTRILSSDYFYPCVYPAVFRIHITGQHQHLIRFIAKSTSCSLS